MKYWKFFYRCSKGRGANVCDYMGEVALGAEDLTTALRSFRLWASAQPNNRQSITMTALHELSAIPENLEVAEPPAEGPAEKEETVKIKAPEGKFVIPAQGEHIAKLVEYEDLGEQEDRYNPGEEVHRMQLVWQLKGGSRQYQWVKVSLHPMSRFYEIVTALLGDTPPAEVEVEDLIGKSAIITIKHYEGQDGRQRSKVVDIRPTRFKGKTMPAPPAEVASKEVEEEKETDDVPF